MGSEAFCSTCQKELYVADGDTPFCPVCSSPLIESLPETEEREPVGAPAE